MHKLERKPAGRMTELNFDHTRYGKFIPVKFYIKKTPTRTSGLKLANEGTVIPDANVIFNARNLIKNGLKFH